MDLGLKDLRALVTGASRGLGYTLAATLAQEGVRVAINSRSEKSCAEAVERLRAEYGVQAVAIPGDVTIPDAPARIVAEAVQVLGGLDLLVTNSGGPPPGKF